MRINCSFSVAAMVVAVIGPVALGDLIPMDPPPRPSGGSGAIAGNLGGPMRVEAHDRSETNAAPVLLPRGPTSETPPPRISFNGVIGTPVYLIPPDTHLAVGPGLDQAGRIVMVTNHYVQIWDKTGSIVAGPTLLNSMFPPSGPFSFDPKILYDQHSGRFFIICLDGKSDTPGLSNVQIGVSSGSVPNNLSSDWTILAGSALETIDGSETWFDYPGIGADDNALFVTGNMFTFSSPVTFKGVKIRVFDKAALIAGNYSFNDIVLDAAQHTGLATVQPAHVFGATDNRGFYLVARYGSTLYRMINVTGAPTNPTISLHGLFPWDAGTFPTEEWADQLGSSVTLATQASRVMNAVYRDGHVWLCLTSDPDNDGETEVVWQDISTNNNSPTVFQHGYIDGIGTNSWTYMPSIAVNEAGDAAICYTQSSTSEYAGVYYAMRVGTDPSGTFRGPALALAGVGFYDSFLDGTLDRWGDYSAAVIDPTDDCFWMANEFAWTSQVDDSKWGTYIASFCSEPLDCNGNGIDDADDIAQGTSQDCNTNEIPDECDLIDGTSEDCDEDAIPDECGTDCNGNGLADSCDLAEGTSQDCNANGVLDECDIAEGTSADSNRNTIPDECEEICETSADCNDSDECTLDLCNVFLLCQYFEIPACPDCNDNGIADQDDIANGTSQDCNANAIPDECDITAGTSADCNANGIPDECIELEDDCNTNAIPDQCDIAGGTSLDCNTNTIPDECDITGGTSQDCNGNDIPDECEADCNGNSIPDDCDITSGTSEDCNANEIPDECIKLEDDCNANGIPDECDISGGTSSDDNGNSVPDECEEICSEDDDCDDSDECTLDSCPPRLVCEHVEIACPCEGDANGDGAVDPLDGGYVLARFGCPVGTGDPSCDAADVNADGAVDPLDSGFVLARFGDCPQ